MFFYCHRLASCLVRSGRSCQPRTRRHTRRRQPKTRNATRQPWRSTRQQAAAQQRAAKRQQRREGTQRRQQQRKRPIECVSTAVVLQLLNLLGVGCMDCTPHVWGCFLEHKDKLSGTVGSLAMHCMFGVTQLPGCNSILQQAACTHMYGASSRRIVSSSHSKHAGTRSCCLAIALHVA